MILPPDIEFHQDVCLLIYRPKGLINEAEINSHLDFNARWIHDFDVSKRVEGDGLNFIASLKF
jgi:hypothetical protein